jgi:hypothetical protein
VRPPQKKTRRNRVFLAAPLLAGAPPQKNGKIGIQTLRTATPGCDRVEPVSLLTELATHVQTADPVLSDAC